MRRALLLLSLALACSSTAAQPKPAPLPTELSEIDHLRVENVLLREARVCQPIQQEKAALLQELEKTYRFSVSKGDALGENLRSIVRKEQKSATP